MSESAVVQVVTQDLERGLEVLARYPADAPEVAALWEELRRALYATWTRLPYLVLAIDAEGICWDGERVLTRKEARGLVGTLANAGIESLTIVPGAELEEISLFLTVLHRARLLTPEDEDDLATLLWKADFDRIHYTKATASASDASPASKAAADAGMLDIDKLGLPAAKKVREQVREDAKAPDTRRGVVKLEKFDSTLYFLDKSEIEYLRGAIEEDYADDIGVNVADVLFDTLQRQDDPDVRDEVIEVLKELFPYLLGTGNYAGAAHILSECRPLIKESQDLAPAHKKALSQLADSASSPGALAQLFHTLEGAEVAPSGEELTQLLGELRPQIFSTVLLWSKQRTTSDAQSALRIAVRSLVKERPAVLTAALADSDTTVVRQALQLVRKLNATSTIDAIAKLQEHQNTSVRSSAVTTLATLSTPASYRKLTHFLDDAEEEVRIAALEVLAQVPFQGSLSTIRKMISGEDIEERGLAEKRVLFEAYGAVAGPEGVTILGPMLTAHECRRPIPERWIIGYPRLRGGGARNDRKSGRPRCVRKRATRPGSGGEQRGPQGIAGGVMSEATPPPPRDEPTSISREEQTKLESEGRALVHLLYRALNELARAPTAIAAMKTALTQIESLTRSVAERHGELQLHVVRRLLYLNKVRIPSDLENFVAFDYVLGTLKRSGIGALRVSGLVGTKEWRTFLNQLHQFSGPGHDPGRILELQRALATRNLGGLIVEEPLLGAVDFEGEVARRRAAKQTYERSIAVSKDLFKGTRMGRGANVKQIKQAVQGIVDQVLTDETSLGGLSALKDYDDYSFTHSVNVCIFCVAIGRRLGLTKSQLYDLGLAALVHDIGMSRIPGEILSKGAALDAEGRAAMEAHTWLGALSIFGLRDFGEVPFRSMVAAYEHHMKVDQTGYPKPIRRRKISMFSKIIAVAADFDAATNTRSYTEARPADEVLRELWEKPELGHDPVIVKALINLLGIYPIGTVVILGSYELALVHAANSDTTQIHRPVVRLLCGADGTWLAPAPLADLTERRENGEFSRSIIKVTKPENYGINVSDYFG